MADGKITIDVMLEDGSVKKGIANLKDLEGVTHKASGGFKNMALAMGAVKVASSVFNVLKSSLDGAISRFDTMQKFPKVMNALGFSAEDSKKSIDKLSNGIDGLPTKLDDVVASTQQMTAITGDLEYSTDTVLALNNAFLASGASTDDASRGMQQFNQMLSTGAVDLQSWKTLQETMPLALQKTAEAMGYTGKSAQRDLYSALKEGEVTFEDFNNQLIELGTGTGMLADLAKENSLGIATSFGNLKNSVVKGLGNLIAKFDEIVKKVSGKTIAQNIDSLKGIINDAFSAIAKSMDDILPIIETVKDYFSDFITFVTDNKDVLISAISGIVGAFLTFKMISSVPLIINQVKDSLVILKGAFAFLTSPIGIVVLAIGILVGAFVYLWRTNEEFRNKVIEIWNGILSFLQPIIETIATFITETWENLISWWNENQQSIFNTVQTVWDAIMAFLQPIIQAIATFITETWTALSEWWSTNQDGIFSKIVEIWNGIVEFVTPIIQAVSDFVMEVFGILAEWWSENQELILTTVQTVWDAIKLVFDTVLGLIIVVVQTAIENITAFWEQWGEAIIATVQTAWAFVSNVFKTTLKNILAVVSAVIDQIKNIFELVMNIIKGVTEVALGIMQGDWSRVVGGIKTIASGFKTYITDTFKNMMNLAKELVSNGIEGVKGFFSSLGDINLYAIGEAIINGFLGGLKSAFENVKKFIGGIASWIANNKGPIEYDRKLLIPAGNAIMGGFDKSLKSKFKDVQKNVSGMADDLAYSFNFPQIQAESLILGAKGGSFGSSIVNNTNVTKTINNQPLVTMQVVWKGKEDIRRTMEKMGYIVNVDERGLSGA